MRWPSTAAAVRMRTASSGSRWMRWRSTSRMPSGTGSAVGSTCSRSGSPARRRAYCRTKNGLPPVTSATIASSAGACGPTASSSSVPTDVASSPSSRTRSAPARASAAIASTRAGPVVASVVRRVQTTASGWSGERRGEMGEQPQRRGIGPVDVLEHEQQRSSVRRPAISSTTASNMRRPVPDPSAATSASASRSGTSSGSSSRAVLGRLLGGERADDAQPGPQRRGVVALVAAPHQHLEPGGSGHARRGRRPAATSRSRARPRRAGSASHRSRRPPRAPRPPRRAPAGGRRSRSRAPTGRDARGTRRAVSGPRRPGSAPVRPRRATGPVGAPPAPGAGSPPTGRHRARPRGARAAVAGSPGRRPGGRTGTGRARGATTAVRGRRVRGASSASARCASSGRPRSISARARCSSTVRSSSSRRLDSLSGGGGVAVGVRRARPQTRGPGR